MIRSVRRSIGRPWPVAFPFFQNYTATFNRGYQGQNQFLDAPGYNGQGHPDIPVLRHRGFDPKTAYGGWAAESKYMHQ